MKRSKLIDDILVEFKSHDESVRYGAVLRSTRMAFASTLSGKQKENLQNTLPIILKKDPSPRVRAGAALALRDLYSPEIQLFLVKTMLHDPDPMVRVMAAFSLSRYVRNDSSQELYSAFAQALNDKDWRVIAVAVKALREGGLHDGWEVARILYPLLRHSNWWLRLNVAEALIDLGVVDDEVVSTLTQLLRQHEREICDSERSTQEIARICEEEEGIPMEPFQPIKERLEQAKQLLKQKYERRR